jgi:glutaredoxin
MKDLMVKAKVNYTQVIVGRDMDAHEFKTKFPEVTSYPYTLIDGEPIGGLVDAVKFFVDKGLVGTKKQRD